MAWDNDKSTAQDPNNPQADEQLTADEWDNHVSEGHFPSDELNFGVNGSGDPVITDPQNGGQTVMRYDRSAGSWVVDALEAGSATINNIAGRAVSTTNYSVSNSTATTLKLEDTQINSDLLTISLNNDEITIDEEGTYHIIASARWEDNNNWSTGDKCAVDILKNGLLDELGYNVKTSTENERATTTLTAELSVNDVISVQTFQNSGSSKTIKNDRKDSHLTIMRLG